MFFIAIETTALVLALFTCVSAENLNALKQQDISDMLETAYEMREEANKIRGEALDMMNRALNMKEEAMDKRDKHSSRSELERSLLETLSLMKAHAISSAQDIADIKNSLASASERMEKLEDKVGMLEEKIDSEKDTLAEIQGDLGAVKSRQQHLLSEVRLISLYKMSDQTSHHSNHGDSDLVVDGQFTFDKREWGTMLTYMHTKNTPNNKLNIHLGGLFRIHRVKVWNIRFCCQERFIGTRIFADERMIGSAVSAKSVYKFDVDERDPTYARVITLHQQLAQYLNILEVQVWGSGPYPADDLFA